MPDDVRPRFPARRALVAALALGSACASPAPGPAARPEVVAAPEALPAAGAVVVPAPPAITASPAAAEPVAAVSAEPERAAVPVPAPPRFAEPLDVSVFQRGNLHTHSTRSDGHSTPGSVYRWYRDHGYAFVVLTDHNQLVPPESFRSFERPGFVIVHGEEVTMAVERRPVHVNALCTSRAVGDVPGRQLEQFPSVAAALGWAVPRVLAQGGVALVNHPNFRWAFGADDLPAARGAQLLEVWSGHPAVHAEGDAAHVSEEALWDTALSHGQRFAGVAVDDTHYLSAPASHHVARPGRGWVQVFAAEASERAICEALGKGRLYASSGASLRRIQVEGGTLSVWPDGPDAEVRFVGQGGRELLRTRPAPGDAARYTLAGGETYVRAKVVLPDGGAAWTQPSWVAR